MKTLCKDMNLFIYITSLFYTLSTTSHINSKLLSPPTPKISSTRYFTSYRYEFEINPYDDVNTINLNPSTNTITITPHLNNTPFTYIYTHTTTAIPALSLHYDTASEWSTIFPPTPTPNPSNHTNIRHTHRRLGRWNVAKHEGRYVADGITRRFKDAQLTCRHLYGGLASIMSNKEEEQAKDLCAKWNQGNCWIGYKKPWGHWEDGRRPTYLHWKPGEPNNYGGDEGCAELHTSGQWNDIKCSLSRIALCERARIHVVGHYVAVMRSLNWQQANKRCQELFSTDLATIENARENIMVRRACSAISHQNQKDGDKDCWLGLKRPFRTWQDGEDAKVTNWADGEPNNAGGHENCAAIMEGQRWNDANCAAGKYFVCNTITQDVRVRKRAEAKRRRQEKEAELEKKRKKMEDQIMDRYMKQNEQAMLGKMMQGQSFYNGQGLGTGTGGGMGLNAQQMYSMGGRRGQKGQRGQSGQSGMFGAGNSGMGSAHRPGYRYNSGGLGGLDNGGIGNDLGGQQLRGIFGDLGPLGSGNGKGQYVRGRPLEIQLVGSRRRIMAQHWNEGNVDAIYGRKCKIMSGRNELCVGHNYINVMLENNESSAREEEGGIRSEYVRYMVAREFVYDADSAAEEQCFEYLESGFNLCMRYDGGMTLTVRDKNNENEDDNEFRFVNDDNWNRIESISKTNNNIFDDIILKKCVDIFSQDVPTKICIKQTQNEKGNLVLYKANVQFLATNGENH